MSYVPWYNPSGSNCSVTNGSSNVSFSGTALLSNSNPGQGFLGPDGKVYQITAVGSDTSLTISPNYAGTTASAQTNYYIIPVQGYLASLATQVASLLNSVGEYTSLAPSTGNYIQFLGSPLVPTCRSSIQVFTDLTNNFSEVNVASGSTADIGSANSPRVQITGSTTINSLGIIPNCLRYVRFGASLTLTYNASSLILPGGANIVTQAGDTAIFGSDGSGNWRCYLYQAATGEDVTSALTGASIVLTGASANILCAGQNGTTNPAFNVDASTTSAVTGLNIKSAASGGGVALSVLSSGANESMTIAAKGSGTIGHSSPTSVTSASAAAFAVGLNGFTNPVLNIDASTASVATGLNIKGAAAGSGVALSVISSGTNENLTINAKGSGTITLGNISTGGLVMPDASTWSSTGIAGLVKIGIGKTPSVSLDVTGSAQKQFGFNSTSASGVYGAFSNSGTDVGYIGDAKAIISGALTIGQLGITSIGSLYLNAASANCIIASINATEAWRTGTDGSFLRGTTTNGGISGIAGAAFQAGAGKYALSAYNSSSTGTASHFRVDNASSGWISLDYAGTVLAQLTTDGTIFRVNSTGATLFQAGGSGGVSLATSATSWAAVSLRSRKKDFEPITGPMQRLMGLRAELGHYDFDQAGDDLRPFLFVEDAERYYPWAVGYNQKGEADSLRMIDFLPLIVAGVQDHETRIATLERELTDLK